MLTESQWVGAKRLIYRQGRLLERKLWELYFEGGERDGALRALVAYANPDGGFGNGIEPDLLGPQSTLIGAETALYTLDLLDVRQGPLVAGIVRWLDGAMDENGCVQHPPPGLTDYPLQPWWTNPDGARALGVVGWLNHWGAPLGDLPARAARCAAQLPPVEVWGFYDYPRYLYSKYVSGDQETLADLRANLRAFFATHRDHYPLFGRHWYHAMDDCAAELVQHEAQRTLEAFEADGGLPSAYPELPWWRPIHTLDALILLRRAGMV